MLTGILFIFVPAIHVLVLRFILGTAEAGIGAGRDLYLGVEILFLVLAYRRLFIRQPFVTKAE